MILDLQLKNMICLYLLCWVNLFLAPPFIYWKKLTNTWAIEPRVLDVLGLSVTGQE